MIAIVVLLGWNLFYFAFNMEYRERNIMTTVSMNEQLLHQSSMRIMIVQYNAAIFCLFRVVLLPMRK